MIATLHGYEATGTVAVDRRYQHSALAVILPTVVFYIIAFQYQTVAMCAKPQVELDGLIFCYLGVLSSIISRHTQLLAPSKKRFNNNNTKHVWLYLEIFGASVVNIL